MKHFYTLLILAVLISLHTSYADGFLKAKGKIIVNSVTGQEVYLKGIGLGGWLVQEGYMLQTSSFANAGWQLKSKIEDLLGKSNSDAFYKAYYANYVNKKDIERIAQWGFNSIRLPMHYGLLTTVQNPNVYLEDGFKMIDSLLSWCEQSHLYLILDMHACPGAQNKDNISDSDGEARLWTEPAKYQPILINLWKEIARRYSDKQWIGGYDLINETAYDLGSNNTPLWTLYKDITSAIREVDKNHIIFLEGNWYANTYTGLSLPDDNNLVISFHKYWNDTSTPTIQSFINLQNQYSIPLWCGETGENSNQWFTEVVEMLKENNIGWAWWPHKKVSSSVGPLSVKMTSGYQKLLDYWKGNASKPTQDFAVNALMELTDNLAIDKCDFHPDIIDALFRMPNTTETKPYADNNIPGKIYGVNYDMGKNYYAYNDKVYKNTTGNSGGSPYNSGKGYRNDGVDIEACSDTASVGYDVGYIESGEWLKYTVNIAETGTYDVNLRVGASTSEGKITLELDDNSLLDFIPLQSTGGYQKWGTVNAGTVTLPKGKHTLCIRFYFSGFNFNYVEFVKTTTAVESNMSGPLSFSLKQNYPNPFNPNTVIGYSLAAESRVKISVYNSLGQLVSDLVNDVQPGGNYERAFDASVLPSGVYMYSLSVQSTDGKHNFSSVKKMTLLK